MSEQAGFRGAQADKDMYLEEEEEEEEEMKQLKMNIVGVLTEGKRDVRWESPKFFELQYDSPQGLDRALYTEQEI